MLTGFGLCVCIPGVIFLLSIFEFIRDVFRNEPSYEYDLAYYGSSPEELKKRGIKKSLTKAGQARSFLRGYLFIASCFLVPGSLMVYYGWETF
jgi:hypothetical protein